MEYFRQNVKVGVFIFMSLLLLVAAAFTVGNLGALISEKHHYTVLFPNANLLPPRAKVAYAGLPVGDVIAVDVQRTSEAQNKTYPVAITIAIRSEVPIHEDAHIEQKTDGMIGDRYLDIVPGIGKRLPPNSTIIGSYGGLDSVFASLAEDGGVGALLGSVRALLSDTSDPYSVPSTLGSLRQLADELRPRLNSVTVTLEQVLTGLQQQLSGVSKEAEQALASINDLVVKRGEGLKTLIHKMNASMDAVQKTLAAAESLLETNKDDVNALVVNLNKLSTSLQHDAQETLTRMQEVLTHADNILVHNDRNIYTSVENLRDTLDNLKAASQQVRVNPSVLIFGGRNKDEEALSNTPAATRALQDRGRLGRYDRLRQ